MHRSEWILELASKKYEVEFVPNWFFKFRFKLLVNREEVHNVQYKLNAKGGDYHFDIGGHKCMVVLRVQGLKALYDLAVDGRSVSTGECVQPLA